MISSRTKRTRARTPSGVACPTVSARHTRRAPHRIALPYNARNVSGAARVVSSVTNITGSPSRTTNVTASSLARSIRSSVQSSAYCRMGDDPMNVAASMGIPAACEMRAIGSTSLTTVRAAQLASSGSFADAISVASASVSARVLGPAPGSPMSADAMPSSTMRCSSACLSSMAGSVTDGHCSPSRSVSSFSSTRQVLQSKPGASVFQSWMRSRSCMVVRDSFVEQYPARTELAMALASGTGLALCEVMPTHLPLRSLWHSDALHRARQQLLLRDESTVATQIAVSEIAAPTGEEHARATWIAERFRRLGLCDVRTDEAGNVIGSRRGVADEPPVVVCAHLDTVFPHGTEVSVTRAGARLAGPGIGDNGRGLAAMLALAEVIDGRQLRTVAPVEFIATTGEEGTGDLRGAKCAFADAAVTAAIALDGAGDERIVNRALGSRRYRIAFRGPGGHSWTAFGVPNAVHAAAIAAAKLARLPLPREPRTTLSVGRIGGGISVNTIPDEGWLEIDVRSTSCYALDLIERELRHVARVARSEERRVGKEW